MHHEFVEELRRTLPPVFAGSKLGTLTGGAICWATIQNRRSRKEIPAACFAYSGRRVLINRNRFLDWWLGTLRPAA